MLKEKVVMPSLDATEKELCLQYINNQGWIQKLLATDHYKRRNNTGLVTAKYMIDSYIYAYSIQM